MNSNTPDIFEENENALCVVWLSQMIHDWLFSVNNWGIKAVMAEMTYGSASVPSLDDAATGAAAVAAAVDVADAGYGN